jgi:Ca-activated chloride channel homolog
MSRRFKGPCWLTIPALLLAVFASKSFFPDVAAAAPGQTSGSLQMIGKDGVIAGACPLKHTDVRGAISGFVARVTVTQTFENSATQNIEAVYTFPLPEDAAVDDMTIQIGDRTVRGVIKKREEARAIYEKAKATGHAAALLDQERPNIFTQSVANILPGAQVTVTISYLQTLQYENGSYTFVFPMVVGPRYIPGAPSGKHAGGKLPDTDEVRDASKITPPVARPGTRAGHDISIDLAIDAGVPIQTVTSTLHDVDIMHTGAGTATVKLRNEAEIPNKDFILKYEVAGAKIEDAVLSQSAPANSKLGPGGYFTFILQPPARVAAEDVTPKELVFVLDTSGSMFGYPLETGKDLISRALDELYPGDTFNIITFAGDTRVLFPEPVYPTAENIRKAKELLSTRTGGGGTEMMKAIRAALDPSDAQDHLRVVCFVTDGYVGNDMEIIGEIQKHSNARVFSFGIGNSVNRFLIEGMAKAGRGDSEVVSLNDKADAAAHRLYEHLRSPLLTDVSIDWNGLPVTDVYPKRLPDLFSGKPLVITGRYMAAAKGTIRLRGNQTGEKINREIPVTFSAEPTDQNLLASLWARRKIDDLMSADWSGLQAGSMKPEMQQEITQLGLDYRLMTQFTSFVAVEERVITKDGQPQRVEVPVEMPDGVNYQSTFGGENDKFVEAYWQRRRGSSYVSGGSSGCIGGFLFRSKKMSAPPPPPPPPSAMQTVQAEAVSEPVKHELKPTGERATLESKLHPDLIKAFDCWQKSGDQCTMLQNGRLHLQIFLAAPSADVVSQLKALGFEGATKHSSVKVLVGSLPVEKLSAIVKIAGVQFVAPAKT